MPPDEPADGVTAAPVEPEPAEPAEPEPAGPTPLDEPATDPGTTASRAGLLRALRAPIAALVLAVLALGGVLAVSLGDPTARGRDARAATAAARADLEQLLSYSYETIGQQAQQNAALLTGSFRDEYAKTMASSIAPLAQKENAVVQARTYEAGVMGQTDDTVTVQVFLNQAKTSSADSQPSVDQNRVIVTMQRVSGRWLVAHLSAY